MVLLAFGVNHQTATVELRERIAFKTDSLVDVLPKMVRQFPAICEVAILSTCNRTELYCDAVAQTPLLGVVGTVSPSAQ